MKDKIPGGYYIKARCIQKSKISKAPPHVREIWDILLRDANHKSYNKIKRGQLLTTYNDIIDELSWYVGYRKCKYTKAQCETAMKWLKKATMIATTKTTRGMIVTILNYNKYQDPKNYENHNETQTRTTTEPQQHDTIYKNDKNDKNDKNKKTIGEKTNPSKKFTPPELKQVFEYCKQRNNNVDHQQWHDYYTSNGWMVGKNKMKDWKAAVRTWERKNRTNGQVRSFSQQRHDRNIDALKDFVGEE